MKNTKTLIFAGHYGSGKTNLAVNTALYLREKGEKVTLVDLDIVNPYFRTKDSADVLEQKGVRLVSPAYAGSSIDLPVVPAAVAGALSMDGLVVMDVGGDDAGAIALGQYADAIRARGYEMLLVVNRYRFMTQSAKEVEEFRKEIESAAHLEFTAVVNNSNLARQTTWEDFAQSFPFAEEVSAITGLPVVFHSVRRDLAAGRVGIEDESIFPIEIYGKKSWQID